LDVERHAIDNGAIINGSIIDSQTLAIIDSYTQVFRVQQRRVIVTPRADYQLNAQNTLTLRCTFIRANIANADIGSFNLVSQGYDIQAKSQMLQATETMVIGASAVNETRLGIGQQSAPQDASPLQFLTVKFLPVTYPGFLADS
jgi:hypothetical protein